MNQEIELDYDVGLFHGDQEMLDELMALVSTDMPHIDIMNVVNQDLDFDKVLLGDFF